MYYNPRRAALLKLKKVVEESKWSVFGNLLDWYNKIKIEERGKHNDVL